MAAFELGVGVADLRQRVDVRDRYLKLSVGDQAGQLGEHLGARPGFSPSVSFHPVLRGGREIDDGVDPPAVGVDKGVNAARCGGPDPVYDAVTVRDGAIPPPPACRSPSAGARR